MNLLAKLNEMVCSPKRKHASDEGGNSGKQYVVTCAFPRRVNI